ncbi:MAG: nucleotidyltransferase [Lactobacillales bacterium]|nr:nucleotidyltransferase [Lactobacillales bacterium]
MNKDITLVILAAGMGSRFGGLKQIAPMGPNDEFIIDYSVYDAVKAGFNKIVFLIKEENYEVFKETIGARVEPHVKVEYCFQKNDNVPVEIPATREKPFGTAHAILCCKDKVNEPFMIINADDFYGRDAFVKSANFLKSLDADNKYGMVGYLVKNTITENGSVKRGVCEVEGNNLVKITESIVEKTEDGIVATPLNGSDAFMVSEDTTVSMNMLLFTPSIFKYIEDKFPKFLEENKNDLEKCEFLIPDVLLDAINEGFASTDVLKTTATWYGVTYKEDTENVRNSLRKLVEDGEYPNNLWEDTNIKQKML